MIDPAEHTGLIGHVMGLFKVYERFQKADADDIEGELYVTLVKAAKNYRSDGTATFGTYAYKSLSLRLVGLMSPTPGHREGVNRMRRRAHKTGGVWRVRGMRFFSELSPWFTKSHYFATEPPADEPAERDDSHRHAVKQVRRRLRDLKQRSQTIIRFRFGIDTDHPHTLDETARWFGITRERVRQLEIRAMRRLTDERHSPQEEIRQ